MQLIPDGNIKDIKDSFPWERARQDQSAAEEKREKQYPEDYVNTLEAGFGVCVWRGCWKEEWVHLDRET